MICANFGDIILDGIKMREFTYVITDPNGMHARPAGSLVKVAAGFTSNIMIEKDGKKADAKRIMGIMALAIKNGQEVKVTVEGDDENEAATELESFMKANL